MTFAEYISGKRVCIIGASDSLLKQDQRELINSYDVVCRINWGYPVAESILPYTGGRCDVIYHLMKVGIASDRDLMRRAVADGVKWVVSVQPEEKDLYKTFRELSKDIINSRAVDKETRMGLHDRINGSPNTGQVAILDLLKFGITELYVTGFDFYVGLYHEGYGFHAPHAGKRFPLKHDQPKQFQLFMELCNRDKRIKLDSVLGEMVKTRGMFQSIIRHRVSNGALEICARGAALYKGKYEVYEEGSRSDARRFFFDVDWKKYSAIIVHDSRYINNLHKEFMRAREVNPKIKIIIELKQDADRRAMWRTCDRLKAWPEVELNVGII
jgi:hypothetical protein